MNKKDHAGPRRRKAFKACIALGMVYLMFSIFVLDIMTVLFCGRLEKRYPVERESFAFVNEKDGGSRVHFLNVGNADAILLESEGRFALIDSGWGGDNPNPAAPREGTEARILDYLKKVAADANGSVTLDFILCSHYHYDHAGGFPLILADPDIRTERAYLRGLSPVNQHGYELERWRIEEIRGRVVDIVNQRGFALAEELPAGPFAMGAMQIQFLNLDSYDNPRLRGENENSVVTLVTLGRTRALLAGDISNRHGLEKEIAAQVGGEIDLLKLPHHGYATSTSMPFVRGLRPKIGIVTNALGKIYPNVKWNLTMVSRTSTYSTVGENGVIAHLSPEGEIRLTGNIHEE
ncbi:MAG: MBL fold metallo-hydrolase [Oscillospiraceae bacterium]|nr:MBL fold metallo-hydrolase [Oscillospiraceae bacterium]